MEQENESYTLVLDRQKSPIAALLTKASSINVPYVRLNHWLSIMPCSWTFLLGLTLSTLWIESYTLVFLFLAIRIFRISKY